MNGVKIPARNMWEIKKDVCKNFGISIEDLEGRSRLRSLVMARKLFAFRARNEAYCSLSEIGILLGGRDHTSIMHYLKSFPGPLNPSQN